MTEAFNEALLLVGAVEGAVAAVLLVAGSRCFVDLDVVGLLFGCTKLKVVLGWPRFEPPPLPFHPIQVCLKLGLEAPKSPLLLTKGPTELDTGVLLELACSTLEYVDISLEGNLDCRKRIAVVRF